ncbi:sensor histidine kinase [Urbifossiella limnaea]|uniref:histidine kinase n=1 Tax=Urbifossiella limnaea TaxID=2528023 RepID=A0A517XVJ8_9BACT|nr:ATP-binding protein [Urbifossiella limnaea]QDU21516.1 Sensor protein FixL [Urbifossiella limnaea]
MPAAPRVAALALGLVLAVFITDLNLPLGVAAAVPYTFAVLLALRVPVPWFAPAIAALCGVLTVAKLHLHPERGTTEYWKVLVNRALALFSIGMTLFLGVLRRRAEDARRRAEEETREHLAALAHLDRLHSAGQLATGLAHEVNQPLAAIGLQAEVAVRLAAETAHGPALAACLEEIAAQSHRAGEIVNSLRRMTARGHPAPAALDVNEVVVGAVRVVEWEARRAGAAVSVQLKEPLPPVWGDRVQLEQVVFNLLMNAVQAVTEQAGPRDVRVETGAAADVVIVTVRDNGPGLGDDDPDRVFERFYTTKPGGMGVGLSISRAVVEGHGGKLWAANDPAGGAVFSFHLPADQRN